MSPTCPQGTCDTNSWVLELIRGFAASASIKALDTVNALSGEFLPTIEEDQMVTTLGSGLWQMLVSRPARRRIKTQPILGTKHGWRKRMSNNVEYIIWRGWIRKRNPRNRLGQRGSCVLDQGLTKFCVLNVVNALWECAWQSGDIYHIWTKRGKTLYYKPLP